MTSIESFYEALNEGARLGVGIGRLEAVRTLELFNRYLPSSPAVVYDIGGATGYYARALTERGYVVHLLDIVPAHVAAACAQEPAMASAQVGDARNLPWPDESADVVLLMGPLYHLSEREARIRALREARRVLRPSGTLFGVIIPRWASTLIGMLRGWVYDEAYMSMVRQEVTSGRHVAPTGWSVFMDGFFHNSHDARSEMREADFNVEDQVAIEGPAWLSQEFDASWDDTVKRERILELSRLAERDPEILAGSPHVAIIARR
jgi:SAM-dependent methyltransferase